MINIEDRDISVVIQGAINEKTFKVCIESVRKHLKNCEVVVSTWEGERVQELGVDKIVYNKDPGPNGIIRIYPEKQVSNLNRQLVSTQNGIKAASRKYILKMRTDMILEGRGFIEIYKLWGERLSPKSLLKNRMMVDGSTTLYRSAFSVSDWWTFGLKEDVENWYNIPLSIEEEDEVYFDDNNKPNGYPMFSDVVCRFPPEQYICYSFLRKYLEINYDNFLENTQENIHLTKQFIKDNLICVEATKSNVVLPKALNIISPCSYEGNIPYVKWIDLVKDKYGMPMTKNSYDFLKMEEEKYHEMYKRNPYYWNELQQINIFKNYSNRTIDKSRNDNISEDNITFVVVPDNINTDSSEYETCLKRLRNVSPKSHIIAVIFQDIHIEKKLYDEIIVIDDDKSASNISNRIDCFEFMYLPPQIYFMKIALKKVQTPFVCRIRTDVLLKKRSIKKINELLDHFSAYNARDRVFDSKIIISSPFSFDARVEKGYKSFSISDLFQLGTVEDLKKLWIVDINDNELRYFEKQKDKSNLGYMSRYLNEQILCISLLKKYLPQVIIPEDYNDNRECLTFEWERIIASNFIVMEGEDLGIEYGSPILKDNFSTLRYLQLYAENICDDEYILDLIYNKTAPVKISYIKSKMHDVIKAINPIHYLTKRIKEIQNKVAYYNEIKGENHDKRK